MSISATTVDVAAIGTGDNAIPAGNLQEVLSTLQGQTAWASQAAGEAKGTAEWAAGKVGFLDYHLRQVAALVNYNMPSSLIAGSSIAPEEMDFHIRQIAAKVGYEMPSSQAAE